MMSNITSPNLYSPSPSPLKSSRGNKAGGGAIAQEKTNAVAQPLLAQKTANKKRQKKAIASSSITNQTSLVNTTQTENTDGGPLTALTQEESKNRQTLLEEESQQADNLQTEAHKITLCHLEQMRPPGQQTRATPEDPWDEDINFFQNTAPAVPSFPLPEALQHQVNFSTLHPAELHAFSLSQLPDYVQSYKMNSIVESRLKSTAIHFILIHSLLYVGSQWKEQLDSDPLFNSLSPEQKQNIKIQQIDRRTINTIFSSWEQSLYRYWCRAKTQANNTRASQLQIRNQLIQELVTTLRPTQQKRRLCLYA